MVDTDYIQKPIPMCVPNLTTISENNKQFKLHDRFLFFFNLLPIRALSSLLIREKRWIIVQTSTLSQTGILSRWKMLGRLRPQFLKFTSSTSLQHAQRETAKRFIWSAKLIFFSKKSVSWKTALNISLKLKAKGKIVIEQKHFRISLSNVFFAFFFGAAAHVFMLFFCIHLMPFTARNEIENNKKRNCYRFAFNCTTFASNYKILAKFFLGHRTQGKLSKGMLARSIKNSNAKLFNTLQESLKKFLEKISNIRPHPLLLKTKITTFPFLVICKRF